MPVRKAVVKTGLTANNITTCMYNNLIKLTSR